MNKIRHVKKLIEQGVHINKSRITLLHANNDSTYIIFALYSKTYNSNTMLEYFYHNKKWIFYVRTQNWYNNKFNINDTK
jgi:hypothetical protein